MSKNTKNALPPICPDCKGTGRVPCRPLIGMVDCARCGGVGRVLEEA
jgi:DnaJ-class molecular chaperone